MQTRHLSVRWGLAVLLAVLLAGIVYVLGGKFYRENTLADLERQFALAVENRDAGAVGEIARRIARLNHEPGRRLDMAGTMVGLRMFSDAEHTLTSVLRDAPDRRAAVLQLRALSAAAQGKQDTAVAFWEQLLAEPVIPKAERAAALDGIAGIFVQQRRWEPAQIRVDQRLALIDEAAPRLLRAQIEIRRRQWTAAAEDFHKLRTTDAANEIVRAKLPAWERVEVSLDRLRKCDAAVNESPAAFRPAIDRALLCLQLGLWQNAAEDLRLTSRRAPSADAPGMLINLLRNLEKIDRHSDADAVENEFLPWLALSQELSLFGGQFDDQAEDWRALIELDESLAARPAEDAEADEIDAWKAERARLVCELGAPNRAMSDVSDLLRERPDFLPAQRVKIMALFANGELGDAAAEIDAALKARSEGQSEDDPELDRLAGLVWQAQGKHARAVEMFTSCMPTLRNPALLRARATSLRFLQRFAEAEQDMAAARALEDGAAKEGRP